MPSRILFPTLFVILVVLVVFSDMQRRHAQVQLRDLSVQMHQQGNEANREQAAEIIRKVRTHMNIGDETEPTVATIVDVEKLRAQNAFYEKAENGDFLVVTSTRAILYRASDDRILDVIPVQLDQAAAPLDTMPSSVVPEPADVE
jgi:hypothetical protein